MPVLRNTKHEAFAQGLFQRKSQDQAYADAGYKPSRHHASRLATRGNIQARVKELHEGGIKRTERTLESLLDRLDDVYALATKNGQAAAANSATLAQAKLLGFLVEQSVSQVSHTHRYESMTEEELRFEIAAIHAEARAIKPGRSN